MGSLSRINSAYIAGFLDGDGSLMLQIKKRKDGKNKFRFMTTICFYQDSRHADSLLWIRKCLGIGYISRRNDGMTELRVNGFAQVLRIIKNLAPFIRFKKKQASSILKASAILASRSKKLTKNNLLKLIDHIINIQNNNYATKNKKTKSELMKMLDITP